MVFSRFHVTERSQQGEARRRTGEQAEAAGFDDGEAGRIAVVVSELAGNLIKHVPGGGELFVRSYERHGSAAIELVAIDHGPGIANQAEALRDGFSTSGSSGTGLGAVARMSDTFDLYTSPGKGTIVVSRIWRGTRPDHTPVEVGAVSAPLEGERVSGDACAIVDLERFTRVLVVDGLGHGPDAHTAAQSAVRTFAQQPHQSVADVLEAIHRGLRPTRGAAVAVAEIDPLGRTLEYVGIGNISGVILGKDATRNLVSHNGIVGHAVRRIQQFTYDLPPDAVVVMHSDGLKTRWNLDSYPGLLRHDPTVVAGVLFRDFARGRDDAIALVAQT